MRRYSFNLKIVELTSDSIQFFDCIIVATNHDDFDYQAIAEHAKLIVDTRGVYRGMNDKIPRMTALIFQVIKYLQQILKLQKAIPVSHLADNNMRDNLDTYIQSFIVNNFVDDHSLKTIHF